MALTRARYADAPSHPRMVEGLLLYGRALGNAGNPREAIRVHAAAAAASSEARGEANFIRAFIFGNAGRYRADIGQYASALADYDSARTILASVGDTVGASYAITQGNRAEMLQRLGRPAEALVPMRQSARLLRDLWGEDHPRVAVTELRMAVAEAETGRASEARRRLEAVAARGVPDDQQGALAYARGVVERLAGVPAEAARWQTKALAASTDTASLAASRERARIYVELARAQLALGAREPAADALERAIAAFRAAQMDTTAEEQWALAGLARVRSEGRG